MVKGLRVDIYKRGGRSFSNGGLSSTADEVTVVGIVQPGRGDAPGPKVVEPVSELAQVFEPDEYAPPVVIVHRLGLPCYAAPAEVSDDGTITLVSPDDAVGPMMGGCFVGGPDSRLRELTGTFDPVSLHDRFEMTAQYASHD